MRMSLAKKNAPTRSRTFGIEHVLTVHAVHVAYIADRSKNERRRVSNFAAVRQNGRVGRTRLRDYLHAAPHMSESVLYGGCTTDPGCLPKSHASLTSPSLLRASRKKPFHLEDFASCCLVDVVRS